MNVLDVDRYEILKAAYDKHKSLIIAFDFDNTVYDFHGVGLDVSPVVELLKDCEDLGFPLICFTSTKGERLNTLQSHLTDVLRLGKSKNILINENYLELNVSPEDERYLKPYANIYLDDKAGLKEAYQTLKRLVEELKEAK